MKSRIKRNKIQDKSYIIVILEKICKSFYNVKYMFKLMASWRIALILMKFIVNLLLVILEKIE